MAQQNKTKLKTYYQTGDIPTSNQYGELIDSSLNLAETALQVGEFSVSSSGNLKIMGSASFVGDITSSGDIKSTGAITCATLNTGQGNYELYNMNQNVTTTDIVTFAGINFAKQSLSGVTYGSIMEANGQSFTIVVDAIPAIAALQYEEEEVTLRNSSISAQSVVIVTSVGSSLRFHPFSVASGECKMRVQNMSIDAFDGGASTFNFTII